MEQLPYIDEHATHIDAPPAAIWAALTGSLPRQLSGGTGLARLLGCDPAEGTAQFTGLAGQTLPGFRVLDAEPEHRLTLVGRHHFSRYRLTFLVDGGRLSAVTHAAFPGPLGRMYRLAVISSGAHRVVTARMVRRIAARA
jgi:hypothetical protein